MLMKRWWKSGRKQFKGGLLNSLCFIIVRINFSKVNPEHPELVEGSKDVYELAR